MMRKKVVWLPYDMDTAIGINNEGALVFGYNLEDTDHLSGGADVYNGQESVLWNNLRDAFPDELKAMFQNLRQTGKISYALVERMFEEHQDKWPEAIFNEDAWFKYIAPLAEDGTASYLAMAQGSKKEQRKWWLYNRFRYLDSKYNAGDALSDLIQIRGYAKSDIVITPYADIYPTVKFGSVLVSERGEHGVETTIECPLDNVNDTEIYIYSASQLASVGDLSGFKVGFGDFSMAAKLQSIKVGDDAQDYENPNLTELHVGNNVLLGTVDARNCTALAAPVDLSGAVNVEHVCFDGTQVTAVSLPVGGILKTLRLPGTITNLTVRNQGAISEFYMPDYSSITTLRVENSPAIPVLDILADIPANSRVRIVGLNMEVESTDEVDALYDLLDTMRGLDEAGNNLDRAVVSGRITGLSVISREWLNDKLARYPNIVIDCDVITVRLRYYNYDGSELLYSEEFASGGDGTYDGEPGRESTAQYTFSFAGWALTEDASTADAGCTENLTDDRDVYAAYSRFIRTYTVLWKNDNGDVIETDSGVPYGTTPTYNGSTPTSALHSGWDFTGWSPEISPVAADVTYTAQYVQTFTVRFMNGSTVLQTFTNVHAGTTPVYTGATPTSPEDCFVFDHWNPTPGPINANTDYLAVFRDTSTPLRQYLAGTMMTYSSDTVTKIAQYAFYKRTALTSVEASATIVESDAFYGCTALETVDLTSISPVTIQASAFESLAKLTHLIIRSATVSSLANANALSGTKIAFGLGGIYVPAALVDTYKAATNWATYAANIYPISEYPKTDFSTITDDWATILSNPDYASDYKVGDTKLLTVNGVDLYMQIAAFDTDLLETSGTAGITWISKGFLEKKRMNVTSTTAGGWEETELAGYLENTILPAIPETVRNHIAEVQKTYRVKTPADETKNAVCKLWIPSYKEVGFTNANYIESGGVVYSGLFTNNASRIKHDANGSVSIWWLRSAGSTKNFSAAVITGNEGSSAASSEGGVVLGFCTNL